MKHLWNGFNMSISMFTILPCKAGIWDEKACKYLIPFYPIAGFFIGLIWYGLHYILQILSIPIMMETLILMVLPSVLSGFLHLDGFMDTSDAIGSRRNLEEKRKILKDSHVGAFAVIAALLWIFASFCSVYTILSEGKSVQSFLFIPIASRAFTGICVLNGRPISEQSYLTLYQKEKTKWQTLLQVAYLFLCIGIPCLLFDIRSVLTLVILLLAALLSARHAFLQLDGMSGDVSGYILTISELTALVAVALI